MAHPQIAVFARLAKDGAKPVRKVEGQGSLLGRTMHGIAYDSIHDEFTVPQQFGQAILTYRGAANGEEAAASGNYQGPHSQLDAPEHLDVDPVHNEIFVPTRYGAVLVFPRDGSGDVAPIREIRGPNTMLGGDAPIAVDPVNNLLIVGGSAGRREPRLLIFNRTDSGDVKPKAVIGGPKSHLYRLAAPSRYIRRRVRSWSASVARVRTRSCRRTKPMSASGAKGQWRCAPKWTIGGPHGMLEMPRGIALDVKNKNMFVSDKRLNAVLTFHFPEMF